MMTTIFFIRHAEAEGNLYQAATRPARYAAHAHRSAAGGGASPPLRRGAAACLLRQRSEPGSADGAAGAVRTIGCGCAGSRHSGRYASARGRTRAFGGASGRLRTPEQMRVFRQNMWAWQAPGSETLEPATGRFYGARLRAVAERHAGQTVGDFHPRRDPAGCAGGAVFYAADDEPGGPV